MIIGVDFDSTITSNAYPNIGKDLGAIPWLLEAQSMGAQIILFTMRDGEQLAEASSYLIDRGVRLFGVNTNPTQWQWTMSPKAYCHMYIDDRNLGTPMCGAKNEDVNWARVGPMLLEHVRNFQNGPDLIDAKRFIGAPK